MLLTILRINTLLWAVQGFQIKTATGVFHNKTSVAAPILAGASSENGSTGGSPEAPETPTAVGCTGGSPEMELLSSAGRRKNADSRVLRRLRRFFVLPVTVTTLLLFPGLVRLKCPEPALDTCARELHQWETYFCDEPPEFEKRCLEFHREQILANFNVADANLLSGSAMLEILGELSYYYHYLRMRVVQPIAASMALWGCLNNLVRAVMVINRVKKAYIHNRCVNFVVKALPFISLLICGWFFPWKSLEEFSYCFNYLKTSIFPQIVISLTAFRRVRSSVTAIRVVNRANQIYINNKEVVNFIVNAFIKMLTLVTLWRLGGWFLRGAIF